MTTNLEIVEDALRELGVLAETESASAEQGASGLRRLNALLAAWGQTSMAESASPQSNLADDFPLGPEYELGAVANLAVLLAPTYGREAAPTTKGVADQQYRRLLREGLLVDMPQQTLTTKMPIGQANTLTIYDIS